MFQTFDINRLYQTLGLTPTASDEEVRAAYLKLVQKFPPDREPERFAEIHRAYQMISHPLEYAEQLVRLGTEPPPNLREVVDRAEQHPPRLSAPQLLSLGNVNQ